MNLDNIDLKGLVILWNASSEELPIRKEIEEKLKEHISTNTNFSREYLFKKSEIENHTFSINFLPTTEAFILYGDNITVDLIYSEEEKHEMIKNMTVKPPVDTSGRVRAKLIAGDHLSEEQIERLETEGFHTSEIFEILAQ